MNETAKIFLTNIKEEIDKYIDTIDLDKIEEAAKIILNEEAKGIACM